ncbi:MAG TPA: alpha-L-arabinofuranosidase C-terminal domain-containing protein [Clostridia bacterium]|nr:alpha-L-arabinofuranosidase C-terminal domain-containing protein [Clostridia bacterium]
MGTITFDFNKKKSISNKLYGLFFEDINFSIDGGINSNQIINARFDFRYRKPKKDVHFFLRKLKQHRKKVTYKEYNDFFRYWELSGGIVSEQFTASYKGQEKRFPLIEVSGKAVLSNLGYNGGDSTEKKGRYFRANSTLPAIGIKDGQEYICKFWLKNISFVGKIEVFVENEDALTDVKIISLDKPFEWKEIVLNLKGLKTLVGKFSLRLNGEGSLCVDAFYFGENTALGFDNPVWSGGKMRRDLVDALQELKPSFVRFPGGCIVEGYDEHNSYYWKNTVGKIEDRKPQLNLWGEAQADGGYMQSYEIGFYEYFLLCEHLGAEPMPIVNAGLACQGRSEKYFTVGQPEFQRYIDDAIDLIEFANGDPKTNKWAKLRADSGHPEPFGLKMIGIGNENWGDIYLRNFEAIKAEIKKKYPYMEIIFSVGFDCYKHKSYEERRKGFDGIHDDCIADDHFYRTPKWCIENANMYDDYDKKIKIFLGEYAANSPWDDKALPNNYYSALAEAAYLTHIERNADKVIMSSYAPLFSRVGGEQWKHNLINYNSLYVIKTANYYVQKLFATNIGNQYIPNESELKDAYRSATTDGKSIYIKLVNIRYEQSDVNIKLEGTKINKTASIETLSCTDDYARNTPDYFNPTKELIYPVKSNVEFIDSSAHIILPPRSVCVVKLEEAL